MNNFICVTYKSSPFGFKGELKVYPSHPSYFFLNKDFIVYNHLNESTKILEKYHETTYSFVLKFEKSLDFSQGLFLKEEDFPKKEDPYPFDYPKLKIKNYKYKDFYLNGANQDILILIHEGTNKEIELPFLKNFFIKIESNEYILNEIVFL